MRGGFYDQRIKLLSEDLVHSGVADSAFALEGFATILHGHFLSFFHFSLLLTLHAISNFSHIFLHSIFVQV